MKISTIIQILLISAGAMGVEIHARVDEGDKHPGPIAASSTYDAHSAILPLPTTTSSVTSFTSSSETQSAASSALKESSSASKTELAHMERVAVVVLLMVSYLAYS
ncbi:hypothetical protein Cantr_07211 [Candida viswanathii]|uniref:Uncharacterized protein n=1 Tax=Candida viswanathii TaxID=5486 RepID=A0A367XZJ9_9ASCO|nr:hypothetical protein Cantr_07211 [Candida viswanathii]